MKLTVIGAGGGGSSALADLQLRGHRVRLWNRGGETVQALKAQGGMAYSGVLGEGCSVPDCATTDMGEALAGAEAVLVCLPTNAHGAVAAALAEAEVDRCPVVLNPGHTGGVLAFREVFRKQNVPAPPLAEFSTLTYVARKSAVAAVSITGVAKRLRVACLPGDESAVTAALELYPAAAIAADVLETGLANVNMVLHPPGAVLGAAWVEASGGDFTFYVQGLSEGVGRVLLRLDEERRRVAAAFGLDLPDLFHEMQAIGTIEPDADPDAGVVAAIRGGRANRNIRAPDSLRHRYYREDFRYGLLPFIVFADIASVEVPVARSLMSLADILVGEDVPLGRTAAAMGIQGWSRDQLLAFVRGNIDGRI
jgi:opine dehydrogenase